MTALSRADFDRYPWQDAVANAKKRETLYYRTELGKGWQQARESADSVGEAVYGLLLRITEVELRPDNTDEPFGPKFVRSAARGVAPGDVTDSEYAILRELAPTITDPDMRARVCDLVWTVKRGHPDIARMAIAAYLASATVLDNLDRWVVCEARIRRAVRLARSLNAGGVTEFDQAVAHIEVLLTKYEGKDSGFFSNRLMELLQDVKRGDPARYAPLSTAVAQQAEANSEFRRARHYWQCAAGWHAMAKDTPQKEAALIAAAETHVRDAEATAAWPKERAPNIHAFGELQRAINALRRVATPPALTRADELYLRMVEHQKKAVGELIKHEQEVDLTHHYNNAEKAVSGKPLDEAIGNIASLIRSESKAELRKRVEKLYDAHPVVAFMGTTRLTNTGKIMAESPGFESAAESREQTIVAEMFAQAKFHRFFVAQGHLVPAILKVREEHAVQLHDFYRLASSSAFVPQGRELTFAKGLYAGFTGDMIVATHLLIPQIEESIRAQLAARDVITSGFNRSNQQNEQDLNTLLLKEEMKLLFDEDTIFDLRGLLIEHHGVNLRNLTAHGILSDKEHNSDAALYLWGLTLRLCLLMLPPPEQEAPSELPPEQPL